MRLELAPKPALEQELVPKPALEQELAPIPALEQELAPKQELALGQEAGRMKPAPTQAKQEQALKLALEQEPGQMKLALTQAKQEQAPKLEPALGQEVGRMKLAVKQMGLDQTLAPTKKPLSQPQLLFPSPLSLSQETPVKTKVVRTRIRSKNLPKKREDNPRTSLWQYFKEGSWWIVWW